MRRPWPTFGRWLRDWFVPPRNDSDWARVAYQPMLYLATWIAAWVVLVIGDPFANPPELGEPGQAFWMWEGLALSAPPAVLVSLWLIVRSSGRPRYFGFWLRLAGDCAQLASMLTYTTLRVTIGDFHIFPIAALLASVLFVAHLVLRDIRTVIAVERMATVLHRERNDGDAAQ